MALTALLLGLLIDLLDAGVVNVALPAIQRQMNASDSAIQWLVAGYALPFALGLIMGGRLGDIYGRKRIFLIGSVLFGLTSALCSTAQTPGQLVAARVAQGLAAALMVPQVIATIQVMYAPDERARPLTAVASLYAISSVGGPILGAALTGGNVLGLGWRSIFLVNIPIVVLIVVVAARLVPESRSSAPLRLDLVGMALAGAAMFLLLYPVVVGSEAGWPVWTFGCLLASVPMFYLFVAHQRRRESPLLPIALFRHGSFTGGSLVILLGMGSVFGLFLVFTVYLQVGLGFSVLDAGLAGIWWGIASPIAAGLALNLLAPRFGRRVVQVGLVLVMIGIAGLVWVGQQPAAELQMISFIVPMCIGGAGMGLAVSIVFDFALADVPVDDAGAASGVLNAFQQAGTAVGVALVGTMFFAFVPLDGAGDPVAMAPAFAYSLGLATVMVAVAFAASFLLPRQASGRPMPSTALA